MSTPSVEASHPPTQEADLLGECAPAGNRLTLHRHGAGAILLRHRHPGNSDPRPDPAADITIAGGKVTGIRWDEFHQTHQPVWMPIVEDWIRATIEAS